MLAEEIVDAMARGERVTFWNWPLEPRLPPLASVVNSRPASLLVIPERKGRFTASPNLVAPSKERHLEDARRSGTRETKRDAVRNGCRPFAYAGFAPERRPPV